MLFLLKRTTAGALTGLLVLAGTGLLLRATLGVQSPALTVTPGIVAAGLLTCAVMLAGDACIHGTSILLWGAAYRRRHRELAELFRGQNLAALLAGSAMAGVGEEIVFRGLSSGPFYLVTGAVVFGLLHHLPGSLRPYTVWSIWEGLLLAAALWLTEELVVTMIAHFLHDAIGFVIFWMERRRAFPPVVPRGA
jgi:membrane protease YdiL (CAAX protease family)